MGRFEVSVKPKSHTHSSVSDKEKQSMSRYRITRNPEFCKTNFNNLWIVTRLFEFDEWPEIASSLKLYSDSNVIINPLTAESATIHLDQGELEALVEHPGKWQECGRFHLKFEKWNKKIDGHPNVLKGYGGWISIENLPLDYWSRQTFEAIGSYFGRLVSIANETLNLINVAEEKIEVRRNLCGFMPSTIETLDENRGNIFFLILEI